ncbi:hypothetical protein [Novosphingobium panipatense]
MRIGEARDRACRQRGEGGTRKPAAHQQKNKFARSHQISKGVCA